MLKTSDSLIPMSEFKTRTAQYVAKLHRGEGPLIITQHGRAAAVLMDPEEYDALKYHLHVIEAVQEGMKDIQEGRTFTSEEIRKRHGLLDN